MLVHTAVGVVRQSELALVSSGLSAVAAADFSSPVAADHRDTAGQGAGAQHRDRAQQGHRWHHEED